MTTASHDARGRARTPIPSPTPPAGLRRPPQGKDGGLTNSPDPGRAGRGMDLERELERYHAQLRGAVLPSGQRLGAGAVVVKVPTPVLPSVREGRPVFLKGKRVVDFLGALPDGRAVAIEAKSENGTRFPLSRPTEDQLAFMRGWPPCALGLLLVYMRSDGSCWAVRFERFLAAREAGVKSWPLPGHESKIRRLADEETLADVGVRLQGVQWYAAVAAGRI